MCEYHVPDDVQCIMDAIREHCPKRYFQDHGEPVRGYGRVAPALGPIEQYELAHRIAVALRGVPA